MDEVSLETPQKIIVLPEASQESSAVSGRLSRKELRVMERLQNPTPMTASEIERLASRCGIRVETGGGRHGKHLVCKKGDREFRCSLPDHGRGKTLAKGTLHVITQFISQYGTLSGE